MNICTARSVSELFTSLLEKWQTFSVYSASPAKLADNLVLCHSWPGLQKESHQSPVLYVTIVALLLLHCLCGYVDAVAGISRKMPERHWFQPRVYKGLVFWEFHFYLFFLLLGMNGLGELHRTVPYNGLWGIGRQSKMKDKVRCNTINARVMSTLQIKYYKAQFPVLAESDS